MKKINLLMLAIFSSITFASNNYLELQKEELLPSHFEKLILTSLKSNKLLKDLYDDLLLSNDCYITTEGHVINCSIPVEVSFSNVVRLNYLTGTQSIGDYRVHLYIFNQGTQMWNSIILSIDFTFKEFGSAYRLVLKSFKEGY